MGGVDTSSADRLENIGKGINGYLIRYKAFLLRLSGQEIRAFRRTWVLTSLIRRVIRLSFFECTLSV